MSTDDRHLRNIHPDCGVDFTVTVSNGTGKFPLRGSCEDTFYVVNLVTIEEYRASSPHADSLCAGTGEEDWCTPDLPIPGARPGYAWPWPGHHPGEYLTPGNF